VAIVASMVATSFSFPLSMARTSPAQTVTVRQHLPFGGIELVAEPHVERPGDHGDRYLDRVPVSRDPVVRREFQSHRERPRLAERSIKATI
jgi:hypothetical protein